MGKGQENRTSDGKTERPMMSTDQLDKGAFAYRFLISLPSVQRSLARVSETLLKHSFSPPGHARVHLDTLPRLLLLIFPAPDLRALR